MASSSLPDWALLDRCIFEESFPADEPTEATCTNSREDEIRICFQLHAPPRPSSIYLSWPAGKGEFHNFFVLAAHHDAVLFQMMYPISVPGREFSIMYDYILYTVGDDGGGSIRPSLQLLPSVDGTMTEFKALFEKGMYRLTSQRLRRIEGLDLGVLRLGEDCAVVELQIDKFGEIQLELHVLYPLRSGSCRWQTVYPKITIHGNSGIDLETLLWNWSADTVVPIGSYLCWVDYCLGGILLCDVFGGSFDLDYLPFPAKMPDLDRDQHGRLWADVYQTVGVNEDNDVIKFILVVRGDGNMIEDRFVPDFGFIATSWTLKITAPQRDWEIDAIIESDDLWNLDAFALLPHTSLQFSLVSMADPNIIYFTLREKGAEDVGYEYDDIWLVGIDMPNKAVNSSCRYVMGKDENLYPEEAKFAKAKYWYFEPFIPTDLPKYLKHGIR
ncbi:hypothetical protein PR202_ga00439 [Eleusine coracana subsp. coracana]|uniref:DUF1618 domain-containing protein n=1 Tax=Eleusine coracana subsp. coracana TaxID=191504 RepID=A0AAV5BG95_ELECO|nr:hypothetical protein PR202_ga00439 [Eleusine coracana subsp. coracana]